MRKSTIESSITMLLKEFAPMFRIAYAILVDSLHHKATLIIRFYDCSPEEKFKLLLDFITLLPPIPVDVYEYSSIPIEMVEYVHRYGKIVYIGSYELYMKDLEHAIAVSRRR